MEHQDENCGSNGYATGTIEPFEEPRIRPIGWDRLERELLALYSPAMRARSTRRGIAHALRVLRELGCERTSDLTVGMIGQLVASRPATLSPHTTRGLLRYVQVICNYAVKVGYLYRSPFTVRAVRDWVRPAKITGKRHLTRDEIGRILDVLAHDVESTAGWQNWRARRLQCLVALVSYTGLRAGEAQHLQLEDVNVEERIINVVSRAAHRLKTEGSEDIASFPPEFTPILASWLSYREICPPGWTRPSSPWLFPCIRVASPWTGGVKGTRPLDRLRAVAKRAGVDSATFQMLRRSVATHMEGCGVGEAMIKRQLRHTSVQTSRVFYRRPDAPNLRAAMTTLTYH